MLVILDTNILISALLVQSGNPAILYRAWVEGEFDLLMCSQQLSELRSTLRKPSLAERIHPHSAGRMVNDLKRLTVMLGPLPKVERSDDPEDDFLLAMAEAGDADYLVTGDKSGLLALVRHKRTRILSATEFVALLG